MTIGTTSNSIEQGATTIYSKSTIPSTTTGTSIATTSETVIPQEIGLNSGSSAVVVVGALVGVIMLVSLLSTVAILVLVVAYQSRKYKRDIRERETRIDMAQNVNATDVETRPNDSYIPVFREILTGGNAAYGCGENRASHNGYLTMIVASVEGNTQESVIEENYYDYIDYNVHA
jgi:hypothetical protein